MNRNFSKTASFFLAVTALLGWFALAAQLYLIIENRVVSVAETVIRYFSFFTILTNIIVAYCASVLFLNRNSKPVSFFNKPATITAITVYIIVVGIVYNAILRFLWQPQGLQYIVDELLHTVIPLLFLLFWILYAPKYSLKYKQAFAWLIYPLVYVIYTAIHGAITDYYPYPFINVAELGYKKVLINTGGLMIVFLGLSLFFIAIARFMNIKKRKSNYR